MFKLFKRFMVSFQVTQELSSLLSMNQAQVEKTVKECKSDDLSAMFNMMLDSKRQEKGN